MNAKTQSNYENFGVKLTVEKLLSVEVELDFDATLKYETNVVFKWKGRAQGKYHG